MVVFDLIEIYFSPDFKQGKLSNLVISLSIWECSNMGSIALLVSGRFSSRSFESDHFLSDDQGE